MMRLERSTPYGMGWQINRINDQAKQIQGMSYKDFEVDFVYRRNKLLDIVSKKGIELGTTSFLKFFVCFIFFKKTSLFKSVS